MSYNNRKLEFGNWGITLIEDTIPIGTLMYPGDTPREAPHVRIIAQT